MTEAPPTEGIKYAGSKLKLLPHILALAHRVKPQAILDGFSGTTRVSQVFAQTGHVVIANDISVWSRVFGSCYLLNPHPQSYYETLIAHLNSLEGKDGWFTDHYGGEASRNPEPSGATSSALKKPWQKHNTRRLDSIREEIERLSLNPVEKSVALTSLILGMDEVDSTMGHYSSYLKEWSPRSYRPLNLKVPRLIPNTHQHRVHSKDIFELLPEIEVDLAYFDPPYGSNNAKMPPSRVRYAAYYHLWSSICLFDQPAIFGKAARRLDSSDKCAPSIFEDFRKAPDGRYLALSAIEKMLRSVRAKHVLLSYSSGGRASAEELSEAISRSGRLIEVQKIDYRRNVMAGMRWTDEWVREAETPNQEFLFLIEK